MSHRDSIVAVGNTGERRPPTPSSPVQPWRARRRNGWFVGWLAVAAVVGAAGGWALQAILSPAPDVLTSPDYALVDVREGTVGRALQLNASAEWAAAAVAANQSTGTVTSIALAPGHEAGPGDVVYAVDLRPVVVAAGDVPAFRDLGQGDHGEDVEQLQRLLSDLGYYASEPDGRFRAGTYWAVRAWQRDLGVTLDGVVRRGDVIFVPTLPARLALSPELVVGAPVAGGEPAVQVLPDAPSFTIALPEGQARLISPGMSVEILPGDGDAWPAEVTDVREGAEAGVTASLGGIGGATICGDDCADVPVGDATLLPNLIHVVPEVSGVVVPIAAVVTTADGETAVVLGSGDVRPVTVISSAEGIAVVEGVAVGETVRTPGLIPDGEVADE